MRQVKTWVLLLVMMTLLPALGAPVVMKTHRSAAAKAVVTVIHFGAPW
jgi:hypothetical protein